MQMDEPAPSLERGEWHNEFNLSMVGSDLGSRTRSISSLETPFRRSSTETVKIVSVPICQLDHGIDDGSELLGIGVAVDRSSQ